MCPYNPTSHNHWLIPQETDSGAKAAARESIRCGVPGPPQRRRWIIGDIHGQPAPIGKMKLAGFMLISCSFPAALDYNTILTRGCLHLHVIASRAVEAAASEFPAMIQLTQILP